MKENVLSINVKQIGFLDHGFHAMYSCNMLHTMDAALLLISQAEILDLKVQLGGNWDRFQTLEIKFMKKVYVEHRFIRKCHILHLEFNSFLS